MHLAPILSGEEQRLAAVARYELFGTDAEEVYDRITRLVTMICQTQMATITIAGKDTMWFKSRVNYAATCGARQTSFCGHALYAQDVFVIENALLDSRFCENPNVKQGGLRFYAGMPLISSDGHPIGVLCTFDVVPKTLSDHQLESLRVLAAQVMAQIELRRSHRELEQKNQELSQLNASKDRFFSIIAHDLKAPFQGILGFSEILDTDIDEMTAPEIRNIASYLHDTAQSAYKLLENLLQWAMLESGQVRFRPKPLSIETLFDLVEGNKAAMAYHKGIELVFKRPQPDFSVMVDENMLRCIVRNLVTNAIKFTDKGGQVRVSCETTDEHVVFAVQDSGLGMTPEQIQGLFMIEHNQSTKGTAGETGTGLGLMLCHQFVQQHQGKIEVVSALGEGSTFRVALPKSCLCLQTENLTNLAID